MSTNLLAFLTLIEDRVRPLLAEGKPWRFQRLVNFQAHEGVLQLWDGDAMAGQADLRESSRGRGAALLHRHGPEHRRRGCAPPVFVPRHDHRRGRAAGAARRRTLATDLARVIR